MGYALQGRVLADLNVKDQRLFSSKVAEFWTLHSGRNYLPTPTAALGYSKQDRNILRRWSAKDRDVYAMVAKQ